MFTMFAVNQFAELGKKIRDLRDEQRLTQSELARDAGVSISYIQKLESGAASHRPRFSLLRAVAKVLDADPDAWRQEYLLGQEEDDPEIVVPDGDRAAIDLSEEEWKSLRRCAADAGASLAVYLAGEIKRLATEAANREAKPRAKKPKNRNSDPDVAHITNQAMRDL